MSALPARIEVLDCSPEGGGRTAAALAAVADAARAAGASVTTWQIPQPAAPAAQLLDALERADGVVFGSPVYRASFATPLKGLLDGIPRQGGEDHVDSVLRGKAAAIVLTAASFHHFLALGGLRDVLAGFFAAHVLPPGLYVPRAGFDMEPVARLREPFAGQAALLGRAVVELGTVLRTADTLQTLRPQV